MTRLTTLLVNNNCITRLEPLGANLLELKTLVLTNNKITNLSEIDNISTLTKLELLSLLENPVTMKEHYRLYTIYKIPSLKSLDFRKVKKQERLAAVELFTSGSGSALIALISKETEMQQTAVKRGSANSLSEQQRAIVRKAIENAKTAAEMDAIERQLKVSYIYTYIRYHTSVSLFFIFLYDVF